MEAVLRAPEVLPDPVLVGDSDVDGHGASIYGSVLYDNSTYRMWYQAWPRDWDGSDVIAVACAESDDGLHWRRPAYNLVECCGSKANHLTDLPFHSPSVLIDPAAPAERRYRAFGYTHPAKAKRYPHHIEAPGYYTAHSADGLHWHLDSSQPLWPYADVITATWDPYTDCARLALKCNGPAAGMYRRRFFTAQWADGQLSDPVSALIPDELDDLNARTRGFCSADYYGMGWLPTEGPTVGFLWNFRHQRPLGHSADNLWHYGNRGAVDLSLAYQPERGGRWLHLTGRPDWLRAADAPAWARGSLYTAAAALPLDDETRLYFTGTPERHGWAGSGVDLDPWRRGLQGGFAHIGLMRWPTDRLLGFRAELTERLDLLPTSSADARPRLALNAATAADGAIRAALLDADGEPLPGYGLDDCRPLTGDHLGAELNWRGADGPAPKAHRAHIELTRATAYAFDFVGRP